MTSSSRSGSVRSFIPSSVHNAFLKYALQVNGCSRGTERGQVGLSGVKRDEKKSSEDRLAIWRDVLCVGG